MARQLDAAVATFHRRRSGTSGEAADLTDRATSPAATVTFTPAVQRRQTFAEPVELAQVAFDRGALVVRQCLPRHPSLPGPLNSSACEHGGTRRAARIAWISFFTRVRCWTIWLRRATMRRRRSVSASGSQTSGRNPAACNDASTPASILSA
jgi:hypothetical protein